MPSMFCYQCEQAAGAKGCTSVGVCGKESNVANKQDELTAALISLGKASKGRTPDKKTDELGCTATEIATKLCISRRTIEVHRAHVMRKLGVQNQSQLVHYIVHRETL